MSSTLSLVLFTRCIYLSFLSTYLLVVQNIPRQKQEVRIQDGRLVTSKAMAPAGVSGFCTIMLTLFFITIIYCH